MRIKLTITALVVACAHLGAQRPAKPSPVCIVVADSAWQMAPQTTQTEVRPGWQIVDVKLKDKTTRYLWGNASRQMADTATPTFVVDPGSATLADFVIIPLRQKREYRRFPHPDFRQCEHIAFDLDAAEVRLRADERFSVTLRQALRPGEYVVVNLKAAPLNESGDMEVYPFSVKK
ncbi:MAG: hypothetical protein KBT12_05095 [Bacteroidales bacterium]|nr:hypothetical protein [Candidatus Physcousia equi]